MTNQHRCQTACPTINNNQNKCAGFCPTLQENPRENEPHQTTFSHFLPLWSFYHPSYVFARVNNKIFCKCNQILRLLPEKVTPEKTLGPRCCFQEVGFRIQTESMPKQLALPRHSALNMFSQLPKNSTLTIARNTRLCYNNLRNHCPSLSLNRWQHRCCRQCTEARNYA